ncbi:MAG: DUF4232 domain-containing protein [Acidimicrobiales bacterium]|jgi:hypothetical protein
MKKRWILAGTLSVLTVALAACSSGASTAKSSASTTSVRSQSTVSTPHRPTSTTSAPTTTKPRVINCQPGQLKIAVLASGSSAGAGQVELTVQMTNVTTTTCSLFGYPGMQLLDSSGHPLPTNVVRGGVTFVTNPAANKAPARFALAPNAAASFALRYEDVPVGNETTCPTSASSRITPPNDYTYSVIALKVTACGGGTIHVSPVFPS